MGVAASAARNPKDTFYPYLRGSSNFLEGFYFSRYLTTYAAIHHAKIVLILHIKPELRAVAEEPREAQSSLGSNGAITIYNIADTTSIHSDSQIGKTVSR